MARLSLQLSALLISSSLHAQYSALGIKAALGMSDHRSARMSSTMIPCAAAGAYFALRAGPRMEIQPELLIASMGAGYLLSEGGQASVRTLHASLPVSLKMYIGNVFNAQAGFQMQRLLHAQQRSPSGTADVTDSYAHWEHGVHIGLGADLVRGLDLGLRCYMGLSPILVDDAAYFPRNRSLVLSAGYRVTGLRSPRFSRRRG